MKKHLKAYFDIPATERRGILALVLAILLVQTFRLTYPMVLGRNYPLTEEEAQRYTAWILQHDSVLNAGTKERPEKIQKRNITGFGFNPNTLSKEGWIQLGFSEKEAGSAVKYVSKGGKFNVRADLRKLFFIDSLTFLSLKPWIQLPDELNTQKQKDYISKNHHKRQLLELNGADTLDLQQLRGIGPYWARRIYKQRLRLGGFYQMNQLLEMKGFNDSLLEKIKPQCWLDTNLIVKIRLNSVHDTDLIKHPYCWYGVGKSIVTYRAKHGAFRDADDLRKIIALRPEQLDKLLPYLKFE